MINQKTLPILHCLYLDSYQQSDIAQFRNLTIISMMLMQIQEQNISVLKKVCAISVYT